MVLDAIRGLLFPSVRWRQTRRKPPRATLAVTELEGRLVPANFAWDGSMSTDWVVKENWTPIDTTVVRVPGVGDTAHLDFVAGRSLPEVRAGATPSVGELKLLTGFAGKTLTINGTLSVHDALWNQNSQIAGTGSLHATGNFRWSAGSFAPYNLTVKGNGTLDVQSNAVGFSGTELYIQNGRMNLGQLFEMNNNLALGTSTVITIEANGTLNLYHDGHSATKGGLDGGDYILNRGTIRVNGAAVNGNPIFVGPRVANSAATAQLLLDPGAYLFIYDALDSVASLRQHAGVTKLGKDAQLEVREGTRIMGGQFIGKEGRNVHVGSLFLEGGEFIVGELAGDYSGFTVNGDLTISGGTLALNVDGSQSFVNDSLAVWGVFRLEQGNTATLQVTTDGPLSAEARDYGILSALGGVYDDSIPFADLAWLGESPAGGYQHGWGITLPYISWVYGLHQPAA